MAYMNQEKKSVIKANMDKALTPYKHLGIKYSLSVNNHSTIICTIKSSRIDFIGNYIETDQNQLSANKMNTDQINYILKDNYLDINIYWFQDHFTGIAKEVLEVMNDALHSAGYYNHTNAQIDYFNCAYYVSISVGGYKKPYQLLG